LGAPHKKREGGGLLEGRLKKTGGGEDEGLQIADVERKGLSWEKKYLVVRDMSGREDCLSGSYTTL